MEEVDEVLAWLKQEEGKPVSVSRNFSLSVLNALSSILSGTRYAHNDFRLKHALDQASRCGTNIECIPNYELLKRISDSIVHLKSCPRLGSIFSSPPLPSGSRHFVDGINCRPPYNLSGVSFVTLSKIKGN